MLSTGVPLYLFFSPHREQPVDEVVRIGELASLDPSFRSSSGELPKIGVKSSYFLEPGYAVDSFGNKYRVLAVEIAWNDAAVESDFWCNVSYRDEQNQQEWSFKRSSYVVDFKGNVEIPETFVSPGEPWHPVKEDACGILADQMNDSKPQENGGLSSRAEQDPRRSITEFIPVPESVQIDHVLITAHKRLYGDSSENVQQRDDFTIKVDVL